MNRMSLIRQLNYILAASLGLSVWLTLSLVRSVGGAPTFTWRPYDPILLLIIFIGTHLLARCFNGRYLHWLASRRPYWGGFLLALAYSSCALILLQNFFQFYIDKQSTVLMQFPALLHSGQYLSAIGNLLLAVFLAPFFWLLYFFPIAILILAVATPLTGFLAKFLYQRRDYLPEGNKETL